MGEKRKSPRRAESQPGSSSPATAPPTAPPSSRSDPSTPFTPASSFSKSVLLSEWWLIKSDADSDGKRLAVGGLNAHGRHVTRVFTSAPIVRRHDAYTVETADGITVRIQGFINKPRTHHNGIPPEVSRCFLVGFPFNWDHYANGEFWNKPTSPTIPVSSLGVDEQSEHSTMGAGSGLPILLDVLTSAHVTSRYDLSRYDLSSRNFTCAPGKPNGGSPINAALHDPTEMSDTHASVGNASLPVETLLQLETDKINQHHENSMVSTDRICCDSGGNASDHAQEASCLGNGLHDGVDCERSEVNTRVVMSHNNSLTVKKICVSKDETGQGLQSSLRKETELEKADNMTRSVAANIDPVAHLPIDKERKVNDERTSNSIDLIVEGVSIDLSPKEHLHQCNLLDNHAVRCQKKAEKIIRVQAVGVSEDSPLRKDSVGKDSDSLTGKMSLSLEASFESPPASAQIKANNDSTPNAAGMAVQIGSIGLSPNVSRLLYPKYGMQLADSALSHAQRIRVDSKGDSEVSKCCNRKGADSLTVNTDMVLETALKSSPTDKERKLDDEHTVSSADFSAERVSNNLLTAKRNNSNHKLGSRREGYALRSRDRLGKIGVNNTGVSEDSLGRKKSKQSDANSSIVDMNEPFEPLLEFDARKLCKTPNKKRKGKGNQAMESRLEVKNDHKSISVEHNFTNALGGAEQIGHMHVQSPVAGSIQEATLLSSPNKPSSKHDYILQLCSTSTPSSPDRINKKGVDHSEHSIGLQKSSGSFKIAIPCSVKHAFHADGSVEIQSDKASDITGKRIEELSDNQDGNHCEGLTEAQMTEKKTANMCRGKTVWRSSYLQESPLTRDKVKKLSVTSPELLNLKRSRSGRLLVPRIDRWRQEIIYDMDGTITRITGVDTLESPCKGSTSKPQKRRKLR